MEKLTRTEVNISTGETTIIELTPEEIAAFEPPAPVQIVPTQDQLKASLLGLGFTEAQVKALFSAAAKIQV